MQLSTRFTKSFLYLSMAAIATVAAPLLSAEIALSQNTASPLDSSVTPMSKEAFAPPGEGAPKQTVGGASRGNCPTGSVNDISFSRTSSSIKATLPSGMAQQVFFSLRDSSNKTLYQGFLPVNQQDNSVQVNSNVFGSLNNQSSHKWSMAIICGRALRPDSPVFQGSL